MLPMVDSTAWKVWALRWSSASCAWYRSWNAQSSNCASAPGSVSSSRSAMNCSAKA